MESLQNKFLVAMPSLNGSFFERTVIYLCEHNDEGAMGLVINVPVDMSVNDLLEQAKIETDNPQQLSDKPVLQGGPVSPDRGFVLHSPQDGFESSIRLSDDLMVTTSKDVLNTLGTELQPKEFLVTVGYAGWSEGQLEQELADNSWLVCPADVDTIFHIPLPDRWAAATRQLGIETWQITGDVGHA